MDRDTLARLRAATEGDVNAALADAYVSVPLTTAVEMLEFFNRMLDVLAGEESA